MLLQSAVPSTRSDRAFDALTKTTEGDLATRRKALEIHRELADTRPGAYLPGLAMALREMAKFLWGAHRAEEAIETAGEATEIFRTLAASEPEAYRAELGRSLISQGQMLLDSGRREDAMAATKEAVGIYWVLGPR